MKILAIEDSGTQVAIIKRVLESTGWQIDTCDSLKEGLANHRDYDLVLLDLNLTDSDRYQTIAAIPQFETPAMVMTADDSDDIPQLVGEAGAVGMWRKNGFATDPSKEGSLGHLIDTIRYRLGAMKRRKERRAQIREKIGERNFGVAHEPAGTVGIEHLDHNR